MKSSLTARSLRATGSIAALALLAACGGGTEGGEATVGGNSIDITAGAGTEGEVVVYSAAADSVNNAVIEAFQKEHSDIKVTLTRLSSGDLKGRFSAETESGARSADLVILTDTVMSDQRPEWFAAISKDQVPNLSALPEKYVGKNSFVAISAPWVITYNKSKITEPPKEWSDLAGDAFDGKGTLADPKVSSDSVMSFYEILSEEYGADFLAKLGSTNKDWFDSSVPAIQKVAAGQSAFAAPGAKAHSAALREKGAPIEVVIPTPTVAYINSVAIAAKAEHPNAARLFADFLLSKSGQKAFCGDALYMPVVNTEIDGCPKAPEDLRVADPAKANQNRDTILNGFKFKG